MFKLAVKQNTNGEPQSEEDVSSLVDGIETLEELGETATKERLSSLLEKGASADFELGGLLALIKEHKWHEPHPCFSDYVKKEHGMAYRKAKYLIDIYTALKNAKADPEKFKDISWCKLRVIAPVITSENVDEWLDTARQKTVVELIDAVRAVKAKDAPQAISTPPVEPSAIKKFKLTKDQSAVVETALAQAREMAGTQSDEEALEYVCQSFVLQAEPETIEDRIEELGAEAGSQQVEPGMLHQDVEKAAQTISS